MPGTSHDRWRIVKDEWGYKLIFVRGQQEFPLLGAHFHRRAEAIAALRDTDIAAYQEEFDGKV